MTAIDWRNKVDKRTSETQLNIEDRREPHEARYSSHDETCTCPIGADHLAESGEQPGEGAHTWQGPCCVECEAHVSWCDNPPALVVPDSTELREACQRLTDHLTWLENGPECGSPPYYMHDVAYQDDLRAVLAAVDQGVSNCLCNVGAQECPIHPGRLRTKQQKIEFRKEWDKRVQKEAK